MLKRRRDTKIDDEHQRLLALINSLASAVITTDPDGNVTLYNGAALSLLDTNRNLTGQPVSGLLKLVDQHRRPVSLAHNLAQLGQPFVSRDWSFAHEDGSLTNLELTITPIIASAFSQAGGWVLVFQDITNQKTLEEERSDFISVVSHELRTPVAIVEANLSTALLPNFAKMDPQAKELITQAHQNVIFLGLLLRDLSAVAKAERPDQPIVFEPVNIPELLGEIEANYQPQAEAKHLSFKLKIEKGLENVQSSRYVVTEILQNFVSNALKYTLKGNITVTAAKMDGVIRLSVTDTGIGIGSVQKHHLFEKFFRAEDERAKSITGTGLGLYLTRKLAARVGGVIDFSSRLNKGSNFWLDLPETPPTTNHH